MKVINLYDRVKNNDLFNNKLVEYIYINELNHFSLKKSEQWKGDDKSRDDILLNLNIVYPNKNLSLKDFSQLEKLAMKKFLQ